jgi:hypothetical protein
MSQRVVAGGAAATVTVISVNDDGLVCEVCVRLVCVCVGVEHTAVGRDVAIRASHDENFFSPADGQHVREAAASLDDLADAVFTRGATRAKVKTMLDSFPDGRPFDLLRFLKARDGDIDKVCEVVLPAECCGMLGTMRNAKMVACCSSGADCMLHCVASIPFIYIDNVCMRVCVCMYHVCVCVCVVVRQRVERCV